jgi:hypothetical protein
MLVIQKWIFVSAVRRYFGYLNHNNQVEKFAEDFLKKLGKEKRKKIVKYILEIVENPDKFVLETSGNFEEEKIYIYTGIIRMMKMMSCCEMFNSEAIINETLNVIENDVKNGVINEGEYLNATNCLMKEKEFDKEIEDNCFCNIFGCLRNGETEDGTPIKVLTVVDLFCGADFNNYCVL